MIKTHLVKSTGIKGDPYVGVIHRLDQPVSGLLVFAKDKLSAAFLSKQLSSDFMNKIYSARVEGTFGNEEAYPSKEYTLIDYMYKDSAGNCGVIVDDMTGTDKGGRSDTKLQRAELSYQIMSEDENNRISTLRIKLKTGRFHQIRAQLSHIGHPIIGDVKYGASAEIMGRNKGIELCACELEFIHPGTKESTKYYID